MRVHYAMLGVAARKQIRMEGEGAAGAHMGWGQGAVSLVLALSVALSGIQEGLVPWFLVVMTLGHTCLDFNSTFYFKIVLDLQKSYQDSTVSVCPAPSFWCRAAAVIHRSAGPGPVRYQRNAVPCAARVITGFTK